jgi:hypothetical protein
VGVANASKLDTLDIGRETKQSVLECGGVAMALMGVVELVPVAVA